MHLVLALLVQMPLKTSGQNCPQKFSLSNPESDSTLEFSNRFISEMSVSDQAL